MSKYLDEAQRLLDAGDTVLIAKAQAYTLLSIARSLEAIAEAKKHEAFD